MYKPEYGTILSKNTMATCLVFFVKLLDVSYMKRKASGS